MYKVLTSKENDHVLDTVLLHNEEDYLLYAKDKNLKNEYSGPYLSREIMFSEPHSYPVILVTYFDVSMTCRCPHQIYGEYIYMTSFD